MRLLKVGIVIVVGIGLLAAGSFALRSGKSSSDEDKQSSTSADVVFKLQLRDYNGNLISLQDFKGKVLVINSWAAWCPFCRKELIDFAAAQQEIGGQVVIIAIDRAEARDVAKKYTDELSVTDDLVFLLDPSDSFYQSIGGFSMPETIFVDKSGTIVIHKRGPMEKDEILQKIRDIL